MLSIRVTEIGGPEKLVVTDIAVPQPSSGQALVRLFAVGVNFIDVYHRTGLYKLPLPFTPGQEGAGVVEAVDGAVTNVKPGDRVCYSGKVGAYAQYAAVDASALIKIPDAVSFDLAAACMLQGMTAHYLTHSTFPLAPGHTCLIHAAAGGTGQILVQMAKQRGARVLATTSTPEKAKLVEQAGADAVVFYDQPDFGERIKELNGGSGVDVVYDSVGKSTWEISLSALRQRGTMVSFGNASGAVGAIEPLLLSQKGSLFLTRPSLPHYTATPEELQWRASDVLNSIASGTLKITVSRTYKLSDAAQAHRDLESRQTQGKLLILPDRGDAELSEQ